jgi:hypothetical protein
VTRTHLKPGGNFFEAGFLVDQSFVNPASDEMCDPLRPIDRRLTRR